ncbi:MGH1-like glycoside hydrolase domain-containing protein [Salinarimonas rosea]|uniref:MGH1-like glycoside hydrolase domain-containing protein n=1 Tax=Salinarimonas rosea TaxID=552063 RepID=UPI0004149037|nr:trehalase family glycosidase [Salinarimonas rosea]
MTTFPIDADRLRAEAVAILRENDLGGYTIPTRGLYPFQWNWDSCLVALGLAHVDEDRALGEIETLVAHQWPDGMIPHIVFHADHETYFPGPDVWGTARATPTSGITQPPVLGYALRRLLDTARDRTMVAPRVAALLPKVAAWHRWFATARDPHRTGLVAILHPWESGRDNAIDWDEALARVPTEGVGSYVRRDTTHVDAAQRPTKAEYDRYLWLVQRFRSLAWDQATLHDASPFRVVDPGFNAILIRSAEDLAALAQALDAPELAAEAQAQAARGRTALEGLWHDGLGQYAAFDRAAGTLVESASIGGLLPLLALEPGHPRAQALVARLAALRGAVRHPVPSHDPADPRFDRLRYWRGPLWLIANRLVADGLARHGRADAAGEIARDGLALVAKSGFGEYFDPLDGRALGGKRFSWTAAMVLEFLETNRA